MSHSNSNYNLFYSPSLFVSTLITTVHKRKIFFHSILFFFTHFLSLPIYNNIIIVVNVLYTKDNKEKIDPQRKN